MADARPLDEQYGPYDEARMAGHTALQYGGALLTPLEQNIKLAFFFRGKALASGDAEMERLARQRHGVPDSAEIEEAVARGYAAFTLQVGQRLLADGQFNAQLNRCPVCSKIAISPMAQWCIWCRHSWHRPSA